jgi:hypothetical protein
MAIILFVFIPVTRLVLEIFDYRRLRNRELVYLELTPPAFSTKTPLATAQFDAALHGLLSSSTIQERLLASRHLMSLELVTTRSDGIRYIVSLSPRDVQIFKQLLASYLRDVRVQEVADYLPSDVLSRGYRIIDFKQAGPFAYPVAELNSLNQHDPISYITGSMVKPLPDEVIAYQLVFSPASRRVSAKIHAKLKSGQDPGLSRKWWHYPFIAVWSLVKVTMVILRTVLELVSDEITGVRSRPTPVYKPSPIDSAIQHVLPSVHEKLGQPLFNVSIRALVVGEDNSQRMQGLANSLYQFHVPDYQGLTSRRSFPSKYLTPHRLNGFRKRLPTMLSSNSCVLAASEIAALYHFPYGDNTQNEDMVSVVAKTLRYKPSPWQRYVDRSNGQGTRKACLPYWWDW